MRSNQYAILMLAAIGCSHVRGHRAQEVSPKGSQGDTLFLIETPSYTILARRREDLFPTAGLNRAVREYERLFGVAPPGVLVYTARSGTPVPKDPPTARDTVRLPAVSGSLPGAGPFSEEKDRIRRAVFALACGWIRAGAQRAEADTAAGTPPVVPTWFEIGSAMLIAFSDAEWAPLMQHAQSVVSVPSLETLFATRDMESLSDEEFLALGVQSAAVLAYFREYDPEVLVGLPDRLRDGTSLETALLRGRTSDLATVSVAWQDWYRRIARGG